MKNLKIQKYNEKKQESLKNDEIFNDYSSNEYDRL